MDIVDIAIAKKYTDKKLLGLASGFNYKGNVDYYNQLPSSASKGDLYVVKYNSDDEVVNQKYAWDGDYWNPIGEELARVAYSGQFDDLEGTENVCELENGLVPNSKIPSANSALFGGVKADAKTEYEGYEVKFDNVTGRLYSRKNPFNYNYDGKRLNDYFTAEQLHNAISAGDFSNINIGDYWEVSLNGTYRDVGTYTCPSGTALYSDTALTVSAGSASSDIDAQWISDVYCQVSSGGTKYCNTSDCLSYRERVFSNAIMKLEIAAINPYWLYGDSGELTRNKPHILFVSRDCLPQTIRLRKASTSWHIAPDPSNGIGVWQGTALFTTLNDNQYGIVKIAEQTDIGQYIYSGASGNGMRYFGETRETESTTTSSGGWLDRGKLFLPTEDEIWGKSIFSINSYQTQLQYPLFSGNRRHISKGIGNGDSRSSWWLMSAYSGSASDFCAVNGTGIAANDGAVGAVGVPLCFLVI